ncbi:MAG: WD40 repeat domain-containing protein [Chloroflexi bacterium]|nr:WD40 repeat domain-containing protein [Chloroflexota bacterium]MCC6892412.1 WD40 repeat domain-containing protein [Anaerolineae bacterium]
MLQLVVLFVVLVSNSLLILQDASDLSKISVTNAHEVKQKQLLTGNAMWMSDLAFSPDGSRLAVAETGSAYEAFKNVQGKVRIWNTTTWKGKMTLSSDGLSAMSLAFSPDGQRIAVGNTTGNIDIWDWANQVVDNTLKGHSTWVNKVVFDANNNYLASASGHLFKQEGDYTVRLWLTVDWQEFSILTPSDSNLGAGLSVAISPDGGIIAAGMSNGTVHLWAFEGQNELAVLDEYAWADDLFFTPNGSQILFVAKDGVRIWNVADAIETYGNIPEYKLIAPLQEKEFIFSIALSPDGTVLAAGYQDGTVRLWNVETGDQLIVLKGHKDRVVSLAFSPDGTLLASGGTDGTVRLWGVTA